MPSKTQTTQNDTHFMDTKDILSYQNKKVVVKQSPEKGQNIAVYVRPGG